MKIELFSQISKFGVVGLTATLTYSLVFMLALRVLLWSEQAGNLLGFVIAFSISWSGHYFWTFKASGFHTVPRFLITALCGYALNSFFVFVIITKLALPDFFVLPLMISITPTMTFLLARYWAFK